jgi:dynein heavy chain
LIFKAYKLKQTEELMEKLVKDKAAVNEVKAIVAKEEEKMRNETELVSKYASEAEKDLADVNPLLDAAKESLNSLDKADISEIRLVFVSVNDELTR